jgi:thiol-activated cytolysin
MLTVRMETSSVATTAKVDAALRQVMASGTKLGVSVSSEYRSLVENSTFSVAAIGGDPRLAAEFVQFRGDEAGLAGLSEYIRRGAVYSKGNPGGPISYTVAFLKDNAIAKMGFSTEYVQTETTVLEDYAVKVWNDGAFAGRFFVNWDEPDDTPGTWIPKEWKSGTLLNPAKKWSPSIAGDARNVRVRGQRDVFLGTWRDIRTMQGNPGKCYRLGGTTTAPSMSERESC